MGWGIHATYSGKLTNVTQCSHLFPGSMPLTRPCSACAVWQIWAVCTQTLGLTPAALSLPERPSLTFQLQCQLETEGWPPTAIAVGMGAAASRASLSQSAAAPPPAPWAGWGQHSFPGRRGSNILSSWGRQPGKEMGAGTTSGHHSGRKCPFKLALDVGWGQSPRNQIAPKTVCYALPSPSSLPTWS